MRIRVRLLVTMALLLCSVLLLCACDLAGLSEDVKNGIGGIKDGVGSKVDEVKDNVSSKLDEVKDNVSSKIDEVSALLTTTAPITTTPAEAVPSPGMLYQRSADGQSYTVRGYAGKDTALVIAPAHEGLPVVSIMQGAFKGKSNLTSIRIPDGVGAIGEGAFSGCIGLIRVAGRVHYADRWAVGADAFAGDVALDADTVGIADGAFRDRTRLTSIALNAALRTIGADAFAGCTSLTAITVAEGNAAFTVAGDALYSKDMSRLIFYFGTGESFTVPAAVRVIEPGAFSESTALRSVGFEEGSALSVLGDRAFSGCSGLTAFTLPAGVARIGARAFSGCASLSSFAFSPDSACTAIGAEAFRGCTALSEMVLGAAVTEIGQRAFCECPSLFAVRLIADGWWAGDQSVSAALLADPQEAALALRTTYCIKTWVRKTR